MRGGLVGSGIDKRRMRRVGSLGTGSWGLCGMRVRIHGRRFVLRSGM
jgi:hypothetical protein